MDVQRLGSKIGVEVRGIDVRTLDDAGFAAVYRAWLEANVLVIPDQKLEIDEFLRYSRRFGLVHPHPSKMTRHPDVPEITLLGIDKFGPDGALNMAIYRRGAEGWHTDGAYDDEPFKATQLYALAIPSQGGDTFFASMYAAHDALPEGLRRRLEGRRGAFTYGGRRQGGALLNPEDRDRPPAFHLLIRTHPETGRKAIFVNRTFTTRIPELSQAESDAVLALLFDHCEQIDFQIRFRWERNDVAFWDNRSVMHRAVWDYWPNERKGRRVTIKGERPR